MYTFNGVTKIIQLDTELLDVKDMYSRWKDWFMIEPRYEPAFSTVGGEPIETGKYITTYYFLINGWRVRPKESNHRLKVINGVLLTDTGDSPFIPTVGNYNVAIEYSQPIKTETVKTSISGLTDDERNALLMIRQVRDLLLARL